jgi:hypothetical protein
MGSNFRGPLAPAAGVWLALVAVLAASPAAAQQASKVGNYKLTVFSDPYQPLSDEDATFFSQMSPGQETWQYYASQNFNIPADFNFRFFGKQVRTINVNGGGAIGIGNGINLYDNGPLPSGDAPNGTLAPLWDSFSGSSWDDYAPGVRWQLTGEGDDQVLKIEWKDVYNYDCLEYENQYGWGDPYPDCETAKHYSFAVWIYTALDDADSLVQYRYGPVKNPEGADSPYPFDWSPSATIGIESPENDKGLMVLECGANCKPDAFPAANTVIQFGQGADLVASVTGQPSGWGGVPMNVTATVTNIGAKDAVGFGAALYVSRDTVLDDGDERIATFPADLADTTHLLSAGSEARVNVDFGRPKLPVDLEEDGAYYLLVQADPTSPGYPSGLVREDLEGNNIGVYGPFHVGAPMPDLAVSDIATGALAVAPGATLHVEWTASNLGNLPVDGVPYWVVLSVEDVITPSDTVIGEGYLQMDALTDARIRQDIVVSERTRPGVYHLGVVIDPLNQLREIDDFNNTGILSDLVLVGSDTVSVVSAQMPVAYVGAPYCERLQAAGGNGTYVWAAKSELPRGLALREEPSDARARGKPYDTLLCGVPSSRGDFTFTLEVASAGKKATGNVKLSVTGEVPQLSIVTSELPNATFQVGYEASLYATGGRPPYTWSLMGGSSPLPRGLQLRDDGRLQGMPEVDGRFPFRIAVKDAAGTTATTEIYVTVTPPGRLTCVSQALAAARVGEELSGQLIAAGGSKPYHWSTVETRRLASGVTDPGETTPEQAPPGLVLAESGAISGSPSSAGSYLWTAKVTDLQNDDDVCILSMDFTTGALNVTTTAVPQVCTGKDYSVQLEASGGDGGFLTWSLDSNAELPEGLELTPDGLITGNVSGETLEGNSVRTYNATVHVRDSSNARGVGAVALRVSTCADVAAPPKPTEVTHTGCTAAGGSFPALLGLAALALLRARRRS